MRSLLLLGFTALLGLGAPACASYMLTYVDTPDGVLASGSGSLNTQDLKRVAMSSSVPAFTSATHAATGIGDGKAVDMLSVTIAGPATFDSKGYMTATISAGDFVAFSMGRQIIRVPNGYRSDAFLSWTSLYSGTTVASMGLAAGDYVYHLGCDELFTVQVGSTAVPEPASVALLGFGLITAGLALRRRSA